LKKYFQSNSQRKFSFLVSFPSQINIAHSIMTTLHTAGLLIVQNRKLLLAYSKNKNCFYLPGGKMDGGETPQDALCREILEELHIHLKPEELKYYTHITAPAFGEIEGTTMEQDCFLVEKEVSPVASAEIGELRYFSLEEYQRELDRAPGAVIILERMKADGFIE